MANINHFDFKNYRVFETEIAGRKLTVETGKMAQLANGSCLVRYGETAVLVTATASAKPRDGIDFFPLSVDFEERMYAVGRIPGSFMRREGRPSEKAILSSRQIDRPMRPLFPKDLRNDVSIVCTVLENDYDNSPEVVALLGASIAVSISDIPFDYVVAGCQVGIVDGKTVINPTSEQRAASEMDVTLCATKDKIVMIEAASAFSASASSFGSASMENSPFSSCSMGRTTGSFSLTASTGHAPCGTASVTTPLPMRTAPCAEKYAAPVYPAEPHTHRMRP